MDQEIQFGDLEEAEPQLELRPDCNRHFAVVPVYSPDERDLPIFVDLDALRDMEEHALSDTSVELGGVLLGGQYLDASGKPFVLITDSLRARHYKATKGSFTFTHDTWENISRERDEFPDELQMVGWYHTHPDWTVFLSGMDMFICDNFFNKPLDVALVIDPCQQDRGFFQWTGDDTTRVRRTAGFYLIASRFREAELEQFARTLEEQTMPIDPRQTSSGGGYPVVHVNSAQPGWLTAAIIVTLTMQFFLLLLIGLQMVQTDRGSSTNETVLPVIEQRLEDIATSERREAELRAQLRILDEVVAQWDESPDRLISRLAERTTEVADLQDNLRAQRALTSAVETQLAAVESSLLLAQSRGEERSRELASLQQQVAELEVEREALLAEKEEGDGDLESAEDSDRWKFWMWITIAAVAGLICGGGLVSTLNNEDSREDEENPQSIAEIPPPEANNNQGE